MEYYLWQKHLGYSQTVSIKLEGDEVIVGRHTHPGLSKYSLSERHAIFQATEASDWYIKGTGSPLGLYVNDQKIGTRLKKLEVGDIIEFASPDMGLKNECFVCIFMRQKKKEVEVKHISEEDDWNVTSENLYMERSISDTELNKNKNSGIKMATLPDDDEADYDDGCRSAAETESNESIQSIQNNDIEQMDTHDPLSDWCEGSMEIDSIDSENENRNETADYEYSTKSWGCLEGSFDKLTNLRNTGVENGVNDFRNENLSLESQIKTIDKEPDFYSYITGSDSRNDDVESEDGEFQNADKEDRESNSSFPLFLDDHNSQGAVESPKSINHHNKICVPNLSDDSPIDYSVSTECDKRNPTDRISTQWDSDFQKRKMEFDNNLIYPRVKRRSLDYFNRGSFLLPDHQEAERLPKCRKRSRK